MSNILEGYLAEFVGKITEEATKNIEKRLVSQWKRMNATNVREFNEKGTEYLEADQKSLGRGRPPATMSEAQVLRKGLGNVVFGVQREPTSLKIAKGKAGKSDVVTIDYIPYDYETLIERERSAGTRMVGVVNVYESPKSSKKPIKIVARHVQYYYVDLADEGTGGFSGGYVNYLPIKGNYVAFMSERHFKGAGVPFPIKGLRRLRGPGRYYMGGYIEKALEKAAEDLKASKIVGEKGMIDGGIIRWVI